MKPGKILCIGKNYVAHIAELGDEVPDDMVVFGKPATSITDTLRAEHGEPLHYEGELAFVVRDERFDRVGFGLDLTKRALQRKLKDGGLPWERCKAFDGSALFSDFVPFDDISELSLELAINDEVSQSGGVALMIYKPDRILAGLREFTTLDDGDIVMTGTPAGVGPVRAGDRFVGLVREGSRVLVEKSWTAVPD